MQVTDPNQLGLSLTGILVLLATITKKSEVADDIRGEIERLLPQINEQNKTVAEVFRLFLRLTGENGSAERGRLLH